MTSPLQRRTWRMLAALVMAGTVVAACGDDDTTSAGDELGATSSTTEASSDDEAPEGEVVAVTAVDYGYEGLPASVDAGTKFTFANSSKGELHEFVAFRLPDGEARSVDELMTLPPDQLLPALGGEPAAVLISMPGSDETIPVIGDGVLSEPGRYAIVCVIPTGADPVEYMEKAKTSDGPPQVDGGPPHIAQGMFAELTVS